MVDRVDKRDERRGDGPGPHAAGSNKHSLPPVVAHGRDPIAVALCPKHDVDDPLGGMAIFPRNEPGPHCPVVRGDPAVDSDPVEVIHRFRELRHRVDHRSRPGVRLDVQATVSAVVRKIRGEEEDGTTGGKEVEENARIVGDQHIGDTEDHIGGSLVRNQPPTKARDIRGEPVHHLVHLQKHHILCRVDQGLELLDAEYEVADVVLWAGERGPLPGGRIEDYPAPVESDPARLDPGADRSDCGRIHELAVDARIALLDDLPPIDLAQSVRLLIQVLGHERTRRE